MRKSFIFLLLIFLLLSSLKSFAQNAGSTNTANTKSLVKNYTDSLIYFPKNSIYVEFFGSGIYYSLNYERVLFQKQKHALNIRIGASYWPQMIFTEKWSVFPLLFNYQLYINKFISFETGIGGSYMNYHYNPYNGRGARQIDHFYISGNIGLRFLFLRHLLIKLDMTISGPKINDYSNVPLPLWGGLSLGYSFGLPKYLKKKRDFSNLKPKEKIQKNSIFIEGLGSGYFYSLNYERVFYSKKFYALNVRIGYSFFPYGFAYINNIPLLINFQKKITDKAVFETGLGARYTFSFINKHQLNIDAVINPHYNPINTIDIIGSIGVRFLIKKLYVVKPNFTIQD